MHFVLPPSSLQHLAAVKVGTVLWNRRDILTQIAETSHLGFQEAEDKWRGIFDKVGALVSVLELTQPCEQQVSFFVEVQGFVIFEWCKYHYVYYDENEEGRFLKVSLPPRVCWTMHGDVDYAASARLLLKDHSLDVESRFELACLNCFEEEARELLKFIPFEKVRELEDYRPRCPGNRRNHHRYLIPYFTAVLRMPARPADPVLFRSLFIQSLFSNNRAVSEYLFTRLNREGKEQVLGLSYCRAVFSSNTECPPSNLLYYLSLMNEAQQQQMFRECMRDVLICLIRRWPMNALFHETFKCGRHYMSARDAEMVLNVLHGK